MALARSSSTWLLLAYKVPREPSANRVYVWRKLKRLGAVALQDAVWVLPATAHTRERFRWLAAGRTAVIITHRFTTAMRADIIHVMVDGRIVESGCHHELLDRGGRYAQSWATQMQAGTRMIVPQEVTPDGVVTMCK